jgi:hypothetical protein
VPVPSPTSSRFIDGNAPYPGYGAGGNIAGVTAYAFWNKTIYAELGGYSSSRGLTSMALPLANCLSNHRHSAVLMADTRHTVATR